MARALLAGHGKRLELPGTPIKRNSLQPAATSITERLLLLLDEYDHVNQHQSTWEQPSLPAKTSNQEEEIVEGLLRTEHEKAAHNLHTLTRGKLSAAHASIERSMVGSEPEKLMLCLGVDRNDEKESSDRLHGKCWSQIAISAHRGVRRMVNGFPE